MENGRLIDILNEQIIFMSNDNKIITKQEFIKKMEYRRDFQVIYDLIPNELLEVQDFNIIIYESKKLIEMFGTKEHEKRVRKILKAYRKVHQ